MNKRPLRLDRDELAADALRHISRFTWLRAPELGRLMYPRISHARKYAEKLLRKLLRMHMLIPRLLPGRSAGTAYVLSAKGASQLNSWDQGAHRSGKDWGATQDGSWTPPSNWLHDLWATGVLSFMAERDGVIDVIPETVLRSALPNAAKHPDGLILCKKNSLWLEIESARKTGSKHAQLVKAVVLASRGKPVSNYDQTKERPIDIGMLAMIATARDERGYNLDHWQRFTAKLHAMGGLKSPVSIIRCWMTLKGVGVGAIKLERITLSP